MAFIVPTVSDDRETLGSFVVYWTNSDGRIQPVAFPGVTR